MKRSFSIRTQLLAFSAVLLLLMASGLLIFGIFFAKPYIINCKKSEMEDFFFFIRDNYTDDPSDLNDTLRDGEYIDNIRVTISDGRSVLYSSQMRNIGFPDFFPPDTLSFSASPKAVALPSRGGQDALLCLAGYFDYGGGRRYVTLWVLVEAVESSISALNRATALIVIPVLTVGIIVSLVLAKTISRPLLEVQRISRQVADLDFSARADEKVKIRELADLAVNVNRMADHLSRNIEELKVANAALRRDIGRQKQIDKMRREFVANVSHEMKTPLCLLQMYAENLKNNVNGVDREDYCNVIIDESVRLNRMVENMLELSAIENGLSSMHFERLDLNKLCRNVIERMMPVMSHCRVILPNAAELYVIGDQKYLETALGNFLTNAADHTPDGGYIKISLCREGAQARLTVENSGAHIPAERMEHIWDSFYKVDEARVRENSVHAGLGLSIVNNIIRKHEGSCRVENTENGVAFSFTVPSAPESK